jgi:hypothetical protein
VSPRPALPIPELEARSFLAAIAYDETPARAGYRDVREVFAGALAEARLLGEEPLSLATLTEIVHRHAVRAAFGGVELDARARWGERVSRIRDVRPTMRRTRGLAALAALARGS